MAHRLAYSQVVSLVMNSLYLEWDEEAGERVVARSSAVLSHFTLEARMTEPSSAEAEAPIVHIGDSLSPDQNTDTSEETVDENDKLEAFNSRDNEAWPDQRQDGGNFEDDAFLPQPDEGVS